ncbi:transcriptional regulator, ArsR family protein [Planococcus donghaensis MPA1U2]|uniref:Transcriptional regulator, ArsR family protein n=1 Tax=Planococcus donghaensis MPA1U2 TaxID=933115 RepID=E7RE26_9BACL|nr:metalloregulator ArsR/SmtB family transcription factor [Planococcus donghaensis]EGA90690.1 transcriptional regulator, ArsR family protein [Planococcus donghaensis MPA1U2]
MMNIEPAKKTDTCQTFCYDEEVVERVQPQIDKVNGVELVFKALSDATRLKVAYALSLEEELCVCDVANILNTTTATASHHLRYLRNMGLVKYDKRGKLVFYSLPDNHIRSLIQLAAEHNMETVI